MRYYLAVLVAALALGLPWLSYNDPLFVNSVIVSIESAGSQMAAVIISHDPKSIIDIQNDYKGISSGQAVQTTIPKVRILVVPGHEPDYGGAEFQNVKERDMTVELGQDLQGFLNDNGHYQNRVP